MSGGRDGQIGEEEVTVHKQKRRGRSSDHATRLFKRVQARPCRLRSRAMYASDPIIVGMAVQTGGGSGTATGGGGVIASGTPVGRNVLMVASPPATGELPSSVLWAVKARMFAVP